MTVRYVRNSYKFCTARHGKASFLYNHYVGVFAVILRVGPLAGIIKTKTNRWHGVESLMDGSGVLRGGIISQPSREWQRTRLVWRRSTFNDVKDDSMRVLHVEPCRRMWSDRNQRTSGCLKLSKRRDPIRYIEGWHNGIVRSLRVAKKIEPECAICQ